MRTLSVFILFFAALMVPLSTGAQKVYDIHPVPHRQVAGVGVVDFTTEVSVICDPGVDVTTRDRAVQVLSEAKLRPHFVDEIPADESVVFLGIGGSAGTVDRYAQSLNLERGVLMLKNKFDRHILSLSERNGHADLVILGENTDAVFFGLASLEQMFEQGTAKLPTVKIFDYADQQSRGIVEGYYGYPYSVAVKKDLMRFMMRMKMNTYMYGAKSDVYHSQRWEAPYPTSLTAEQVKNGLLTQSMIREITTTSRSTKVNFIWAIHPGNHFVGDADVVERIMSKYAKMYDLGVRQFAVFVDDVGVPKSEADCKTNADRLTALQAAIDKKWNAAGTKSEDHVRPLHFVPQVYTLSWVGEADRKRFYNALSRTPNKITIYITGRGVWTVPNSHDLSQVRQELKRPVAWWWNYPCNDNADGQIYASDMYYNFFEMPAVESNAKLPRSLEHGLGIVSNPMQEGEISKMALFSVADYAWNNSSFDAKASWKASFRYSFSSLELQDAYKTLAPYLRWNDPTEMQRAIAAFKSGNRNTMRQLLDRLSLASDVLAKSERSAVESDRLLYADLAPWLNKLRSMIRIAKGMLTAAEARERSERWENYVEQLDPIENLASHRDFTVSALEGLGEGIHVSRRQSEPSQKFFAPFMAYLRENGLGKNPFGRSSRKAEVLRSAPEIVASVTVRGAEIFLTSAGLSIPEGGYVGIAFDKPFSPTEIHVADSIRKRFVVQWSENGKKWVKLSGEKVDEGQKIKYIVCLNTVPSAQHVALSRENFRFLLPALPTLRDISVPTDVVGETSTPKLGKRAVIDGDPSTFFAAKRNQMRGDHYTVTLGKATDVKDVRVYFGTKNGDFLQSGTVEASNDGKNWTMLHLKGSSVRGGGMAQSNAYAEDIRYVDFEGEVSGAKFVRLNVTFPLTSKWLRLYEIQVNVAHHAAQFLPSATDGDGNSHPEITESMRVEALSMARGGEIRYALRELLPLSKVEIYWNPRTWEGAARPVLEWTAAGEEWRELGDLEEAITVVDAAQIPGATAVRVRWSGTLIPAIYRFVTFVADGVPDISPTALGRGVLDAREPRLPGIYDLFGRRLRPDNNTVGLSPGWYIVGGRKVLIY